MSGQAGRIPVSDLRVKKSLRMSQILRSRSCWGRGPNTHTNQNVATTSPETLKPSLTVVDLIAGKKWACLFRLGEGPLAILR